MGRFLSILLITLALFLGGFIYWRYYWVFGEGVKAGELNFVVKKGYIFKPMKANSSSLVLKVVLPAAYNPTNLNFLSLMNRSPTS